MSKQNESEEYIFVKSFRHHKTGKVIHASQCGKTAFRIKVRQPKK